MTKSNFINLFEKKVKKTIEEYNLCSKKDKILVAASGGKDSTTVLYLLKKFGYQVEALHINLLMGDYSKRNLENIKKFCREEGIRLHILDLRKEFGGSVCFIRSKIQAEKKLSNCLICGIIKRWLLNKKARELGATKLATGHNLDDEAETILMNLLKGKLELNLGLGPKVGIIKDKKLVPRIKPLYFWGVKEIKKYSQLKNFPVVYEPCPCALDILFRKKIRRELEEGEKENPKVKEKIVKTFLKILPKLRENYESGKINYCQSCGEPSRGHICRMCELIKA